MNLETQVKHYDKEYRNGNALISDKKFDELEKKLFILKPESDYFQQKLVLPSIEKDTIENFITGLHEDEDIVVEPKIDGCAVAIEYKNGILTKAITRKGKDITNHIVRIKTVPLTIPIDKKIIIRGELYADLGYGKIKPGDGAISQRIAAGYLRTKRENPNDYLPNPKLKFSAFQIMNAKINQWDALSLLRKLGLKHHNCSLIAVKTLKIDFVHWYKTELPTDGIVLKINDYKLQQTRPCNWQVAIKY